MPAFQICEHGKVTVRQGNVTEDCGACNKNSRRYGSSPYVEKIDGFFNVGLGCVTYGTRDAEKKAKSMGLIPMGNERIEKFKRSAPKDTVTPILESGLKQIKTLSEVR